MGKKSNENTRMKTLGGLSDVESVIYIFENDVPQEDFEKANAEIVEILEKYGLAGVIPVSSAAWPTTVNLPDLAYFCRITNTNRKV